MKNLFTLLSHLRGSMGNLQSKDVRHDHRLTVGSPSGFNSKLMLKLVSVLVLILTVGVGNAWGGSPQEITPATSGWSTTAGAQTGTVGDITVSTTRGVYNTQMRVYSGETFTVECSAGNMSKIVFTSSSGNFTTADVGSYATGTKTWTGTANSVTFSNSAQVRVTKVTVTYSASASVSAPTFGVTAGTYSNNQSVTLSCATAGATIYYTSSTNGVAPADPTSSSTAYSSAITVNHDNTIIKAIAIKGGTNSTVASATYRLTCATPTFSPTAGEYVGTQSVTISSETSNANIYYTTNGSTPTTSSTLYSGAITVSSSQTIKALVTKSNYTNSAVGSAAYTITPAYTVTWKNQGATVTTTNVASGSKPVFPDMSSESGCQTYTYFYGWAEDTWSGEVTSPGTSSTVKVYKSASEMPNVTGDGVVYHAVWGDSPGGWAAASSVSVGDVIVITDKNDTKELTGIYMPSSTYIGKAESFSTTPNGTYPLTVVTGYNSSGVALKNGDDYLLGSSSNDLSKTTTLSALSSWTLSYDGVNDDWSITNNDQTSRRIRFNGSTSPNRFCTYTSAQTGIHIWKHSAAANCVTSCCNQLAAINGSVSSYTQTSVTLQWDKLSNVDGTTPYTVTCSPAGTVGSIDLSGAKATCTVTGLSCGTSYTFSITAHGTTGYCDKTQSGIAQTTSSYSVGYSVTNGSKTSGDATTCGPLTAVFSANSGYHLPDKAAITVTGASDFSWTKATGTLTITAGQITGNINISFTCPADACADAFSLHTGTKGGSDWLYNKCFSDADWGEADDAIWVGEFPSTNECYVGYAGGDSYHGAYWAVGGIKTYNIPNGRTLGWNGSDYYSDYPATALGTFHIYKNSTDANYYLRFKPTSYVLRTGSDGTSWTSRDMTVSGINSNYYESDFVTLTSTLISEHAYVDLKANNGDGHVWCNFSNDCTASGNVKVKNGASTFRATDLQASDNGTYGKFQIDITQDVDNWKLAFVPYYRITYNANGGSGSTAASSYVEVGSTAAAAANGFTAPTGKQFGGWATSADGSKAYDPTDAVTLNSNVELFAIWTDINYTVTVNQNPSVGATTTGQTTTGHYNGTINLTTTIPDGYRFVNWTTSDGFSITNSTSATTASFTMPAKNVTVTANFQQTHTVDWYVGGSAPANKIGDDGQTTVVDHGGKISAFPATTPDGSACDKTFVGWTNTTSYTHGTSLLFTDVAGSPAIEGNTSFYAVFAEVSGSGDFELVTSITQLSAGDEVTIASVAGNSQNGAVIKAYNNGNNWPEASVTTSATGTIAANTTDMQTFTLEAGTETNSWAFNDGTGYPYAASSSSNHMKREAAKSANSSFSITIDGSTSVATIVAQGDYTRNVMQYNSSSNLFACYGSASQASVYLYKKPSYTGHTINCADCGTSVTPTYTAAPTGGTVSVTKSASSVASGSTVKTCTAVDLTVTITPASHYTLTGFTATGLTTGTATISPAVNTVVPTTSAQTFTVTVSAGATGTLNLTPTLEEDAHIAINWHVPTGSADITAGEGKTWVYSGGNLSAIPNTPSSPTGCSEEKTFVGWSEKHSGSTEEDASYYDDLFNAVGDAPTGITAQKDFYAVYAHGSSNPLAGTVMWDEPFTGFAADAVPTAKSSGATVYNSTVLTYACEDGGGTTKIYTADLAGGSSPELLVAKSGGSLTVSNIPTAGQTELTLSYKANYALAITSGTSGVTIGDPSVSGTTYTHTLTISQSPSAVNNFSLVFTKSTTGNARLDDIHLVVPGSSSYTNYVTDCEAAYIITYNKNTSDPVTNLPGQTGVPQSTGAGTLSSTVPVRATYTFLGWATSAGGNVAYAAGGSISGVSADMDLYAVWEKTPVEELFLNYSELNKYVGDPAVTLEVTGVTPEGADPSVTWSSSNSSVASVAAATGVVTFGTVGTATITATSTVTGTTTAYCYVTVRNKPMATFVDLIHDGNGTDLSTYNMQNVAGTPIVFPTLDDYATPGDDCDSKHYVFVGWTTSDNNDDPQNHLVASGELEDGQDKVFYAVWADGVEGVSYTKLTTSTFKTSPTKYVIGAIDGDETFYFYSCAATDANNGNGGCTNAPGTNAPIQFTLSGTADALVATSTEATARYLTPLTVKNFQMSATSKTIQLNDDGTIANPSDDSWTLRFNTSEDYLRWYSSATGNSAYFYEVTAGAAVSYRTSCCTNNVPAPTVVATNTAYTVTLTWAAVDGATGYEVSWNGGAFEAATSPCVKSGLTASTDYIYKVRATYDPLVKCGALVASGSVTTDDVYTVTYSGGTGTGSCSPSGSVAPASYEAGATVTLAPTNSFSLTSNTFAAWVVKDADDNVIPVSNNQFTMPAKNVTVTATWTAVQDKYYDRMHDGTDASHGGIADGEGKYYLVLEGCNYTVPTLTDDDEGDTECHTTHFKLLGWIAQSHLKTDGSGQIKPGEESYIFQGGGTKSATGATYYAIWAIMTE